MYNMQRAVVTGANGFVGSAVVKCLMTQGVEVIAVGHNDNFSRLDDALGLTKLSVELSDLKALQSDLHALKPDVFYHFAWQGSAGAARADVQLQLNNVQYTVEALELAAACGCRRFVGAGSIMEQESIAATYTPGSKPALGCIYSSAKVIAHSICMSMAVKFGIDLIWPEITNAYGVGELSPRMVNTTIRKVIEGIPPQFTAGTQNYDFVYIDDVARAFVLLGAKGKPFHTYVIGSGNPRPLRDFLVEMKDAIAPDLKFVFGNIPFSGTNLPLSDFDASAAERDAGFKAEVSFAEGVYRTKKWLEKIVY